MYTLTMLLLHLSGISGILGALLFVIGDLLYNHIPGSSKSPTEKMSGKPKARLLNAGTLGLVGCWFYTLASAQIYIAFQPAGVAFASVVFLLFATVMICYGVTHTAYFAIASGAQAASRFGLDIESGGKLGNTFYRRLVNITYIPVFIASVMMLYGILAGKSMYPRWMVLFLPIIIYLLKTWVVRILKGRLQEIVNDSYDNLVLLVFLLISTLVLWNSGIP
jgi:hypothetical protein